MAEASLVPATDDKSITMERNFPASPSQKRENFFFGLAILRKPPHAPRRHRCPLGPDAVVACRVMRAVLPFGLLSIAARTTPGFSFPRRWKRRAVKIAGDVQVPCRSAL